MSKNKPSRIAKLEKTVQDLIYFTAAMKNKLELLEKTFGEYVAYKKDWKKFNKYVDEKKKMFDKMDK
jgi:phosphoribulokinase